MPASDSPLPQDLPLLRRGVADVVEPVHHHMHGIGPAESRIYLASEDSQVTIVQAGREWTVRASSDLGEPVFATPALLAGRVYVRTASALYAFAK